MARNGRNDVTALPYGINTPSVFAFIFLVMGPVYAETGDHDLAWRVGLVACLVSGLIESAGAFIGPWIRRYTPRAALLAAIAGIALTFISMDFVFRIFARPAMAIVPMMIILVVYAARLRLPFGIPGGLLALVVGTATAWLLRVGGYEHFQPLQAATAGGLYLPVPAINELVETLRSESAWRYAAVMVPMGLFNVIGSLQNLESAEAGGDAFDTRSSMLCNGLGTVVAAGFGSCFPTTIYIGHPGWKAMGARAGYSIINGLVIVLLCCTGGLLVVLRIVPLEAALGILLWIGMVMTAQAFQEVPKAHAPAVALGLVPALGGWLLLNLQTALSVGGIDWTEVEELFGEKLYIGGVVALSQGFLLTAMVLAAMLVHVIEHRFRVAAVWALVAAVLSATGLIHAYELSAGGVLNSFGRMQAPGFAAAYTVTALFLWGCSFLVPRLGQPGEGSRSA